MDFNFELILFYAVLVTGVLWFACAFYLLPKRRRQVAQGKIRNVELPPIIEYPRSFFPILLIVLLIRSFVAEPFRIPSGSLEPTLYVGDFILVNKFSYGVRLPVSHTEVLKTKTPKRGDITVFRWPPNPNIDYIKRVIGLPGDHISYINKVLYVNGKSVPQEFLQNITQFSDGRAANRIEKTEDFFSVKHHIYVNPDKKAKDIQDLIVPKNHYFVLGDNRDDSSDSRYWGFVPEKNLVGKAFRIWFSWNSVKHMPRWERIAKPII